MSLTDSIKLVEDVLSMGTPSALTVLKEHLESLSGIEFNFRRENNFPDTNGIWTEFDRINVVQSGFFRNSVHGEEELIKLAKKLIPYNLQPSDMIRCRTELGILIYPKLFFDEEIPGEELGEKHDSSIQYLGRTVVTCYPHKKIYEEASRNIWYEYASRIPENVLTSYDGKRRIYIPRPVLQTHPKMKQEEQPRILGIIRGILPVR